MENTETNSANSANTKTSAAPSREVSLATRCPKCRRPMALPLPPGLVVAAAERLAGLVLCAACLDADAPAPPPPPRVVRLPYRDD